MTSPWDYGGNNNNIIMEGLVGGSIRLNYCTFLIGSFETIHAGFMKIIIFDDRARRRVRITI